MTGVGQHVDISMYDAMASLLSQTMSQYVFAPDIVKRGVSAASAPYGAYAASDGYFVVAVVTEPVWKSFCERIGHPGMASDPALQTGRDRASRSTELKEMIEAWAATRKVEDVVKIMADAGVPVCKVQDLPDLLTCPHLAARDMILQVDDPVAGTKPVMGFPIRLSGSSPRSEPPPQFGQHTDEVLRQDLGLSAEQIEALRGAGIVK
jgi:formyl-CoA transferase